MWARESRGNGIDSWGLAIDPQQNVFVGGYTLNSGTYMIDTVSLPNGSTPQVIIAKYNVNGRALWAKRFLGGNSLFFNIVADHAGNVIVLGAFQGHITIDALNLYSNPSYSNQYFIAKLDGSGNVLWADTTAQCSSCTSWSCKGLYHFPGGYFNTVSWGGITTDSADNIYITGNFDSHLTTIGSTVLTNLSGVNQDDVFIAKYSAAGTPVWATSFGGSSNDDAYSIAVSETGNIYVTGSFASPSISFGTFTIANTYGVENAYVAEFSPAGAPVWAQSTGGSYSSIGMSVASDNYGNTYMTGGFGNDNMIFDGVTISKTYPDTSNLLELFLLKISASNSVTWVKTIGSPTHSVMGCAVTTGLCGQVWVGGLWNVPVTETVISGFTNDSAKIDGHIIYTPDSSTEPIFIAGYDPDGSVVRYTSLQAGGDDQIGLALDPKGNVLICGDYQNKHYTNFILGTDTLRDPLYPPYYENLYLAKYSNIECEGIIASNVPDIKAANIHIYPVPAFNVLHVDNIASQSRYILFNGLGVIISEGNLDRGNNLIHLPIISQGLYILRTIPLSGITESSTFKVVIE